MARKRTRRTKGVPAMLSLTTPFPTPGDFNDFAMRWLLLGDRPKLLANTMARQILTAPLAHLPAAFRPLAKKLRAVRDDSVQRAQRKP